MDESEHDVGEHNCVINISYIKTTTKLSCSEQCHDPAWRINAAIRYVSNPDMDIRQSTERNISWRPPDANTDGVFDQHKAPECILKKWLRLKDYSTQRQSILHMFKDKYDILTLEWYVKANPEFFKFNVRQRDSLVKSVVNNYYHNTDQFIYILARNGIDICPLIKKDKCNGIMYLIASKATHIDIFKYLAVNHPAQLRCDCDIVSALMSSPMMSYATMVNNSQTFADILFVISTIVDDKHDYLYDILYILKINTSEIVLNAFEKYVETLKNIGNKRTMRYLVEELLEGNVFDLLYPRIRCDELDTAVIELIQRGTSLTIMRYLIIGKLNIDLLNRANVRDDIGGHLYFMMRNCSLFPCELLTLNWEFSKAYDGYINSMICDVHLGMISNGLQEEFVTVKYNTRNNEINNYWMKPDYDSDNNIDDWNNFGSDSDSDSDSDITDNTDDIAENDDPSSDVVYEPLSDKEIKHRLKKMYEDNHSMCKKQECVTYPFHILKQYAILFKNIIYYKALLELGLDPICIEGPYLYEVVRILSMIETDGIHKTFKHYLSKHSAYMAQHKHGSDYQKMIDELL